MGSSSSKDVVNDLINISIDITNKYSQNCSSKTTNNQKIDINGCTNVIVNHVTDDVYTFINVACLQQDNTQTQISADISQSIQQVARAITQNFGLPSRSKADTMTNLAVQLGISVVNEYTSKCIQQFATDQTIQCTDSTNVVISNVSQKDTQKQITNCALTATTNNAAAIQLQQIIKQTAVAKQENVFDVFFFIIFIAVLILLVIIMAL